MAKDINIHIKTPGAQQAKQQLDTVGEASKKLGDKTAAGQKKAASATGETTQKLSRMGGVVTGLKTQVLGLVKAWLGIQTVIKIVTWLIEKLERVAQLQKEIYEKSISFMEVGQALEFQTGTVGRQQFWAKQAAQLQKAGGLRPGVAGQMLTSMDIALAAQGGIKSAQVRQLAQQLAPFAGTAGMGPEEIAKLFEFAGTAGVTPTVESYTDYFAKIQAGYTASKATQFGQFLIGLQKGGTAYMGEGGTLGEAISTFAGARAVMSNEALAATLLEQVVRISGGGYEKPRQAIEQALGVRWPELSMDERTRALLQYVGGIPAAQRTQLLVEQGFPPELTTGIGKMVSPEAMATMAAARERVAGATGVTVDEQTRAYMRSVLGRARVGEAKRALDVIGAGPAFASWQERLKDAESKFKVLAAQGRDRLTIPDVHEPTIMALESLLADYDTFITTLPEEQAAEFREVREDLARVIGTAKALPGTVRGTGRMYGWGYEFQRALRTSQRAQTVINYDYSIKNYPRVGDDERGPRVDNDIQ